MKYPLYLASNSASRKHLLEASGIPFSVISQYADESKASLEQSLKSLVLELAELKMKHIVSPLAQEGQIAYFLTADTMTIDNRGKLYGKPIDTVEAISMLKSSRAGVIVGTAFCLDRKIYANDAWVMQDRIIDYAEAFCIIDIPDSFIQTYIDNVSVTDISGGISIEGFGDQFVKEIRGSYSAILGLPMYKVREALCALGFYS